jgi:hypothetical protein
VQFFLYLQSQKQKIMPIILQKVIASREVTKHPAKGSKEIPEEKNLKINTGPQDVNKAKPGNKKKK